MGDDISGAFREMHRRIEAAARKEARKNLVAYYTRKSRKSSLQVTWPKTASTSDYQKPRLQENTCGG